MRSIRIYSLVGACLALMAACTSSPISTRVDPGTRDAEASAALEAGDFVRARELYSSLVENSLGAPRQTFLLGLARAEAELGNADAALAALANLPPALPEPLQAERASVQAKALFAVGRTVEAIRVLVDREIWLESSEAVARNQAELWEGLSQPLSATAARQRTGDATIDGWLALIPLTGLADDSSQFLDALVDWREQFPNHPAARGILVARVAEFRGPSAQPNRIALLLPQSELRAESEAVLEGFFAAHFDSDRTGETTIQVYDTAQRGSVESFLSAQLAGADFVVGPLLTPDVERVQAQAGFVPTLALNLGAAQVRNASNFYQFALSSDDEVEAIAARAIADGHRTAVGLYASNERGYRLMREFRAAFESRGGRILNEVAYNRDSNNLAAPIEALLNIDRSEARFERLRANLGMPVEFEPRRRNDIDMIFLQADAAIGRLLVPLLRDNNADPEELPTYATSEVYDPNRQATLADLNGLKFPDLPLLVDPAAQGATSVASALNDFSSASAAVQQRLFAFGYDAYRIVEALVSGAGSGWPLAGATGDLYLGENGRIRRRLPFAEIRAGRPQALSPTLETVGRR